MARIRGRNTGPEVRLQELLEHRADEFHAHGEGLVGRPDVVFPEQKVAVFLDGCFWHGCPQHYVRPRSREEFWRAKLIENVLRDRAQTEALESGGWRVVRLWEHEVYEQPLEVVARVEDALDSLDWQPGSDLRVVLVEGVDDDRRIERRHLEDLRRPAERRVVEGRRVTAKWRRPRPPSSEQESAD